MCGRFTQTNSSSEIAKAFNLADVPPLEPQYNITPTQQVATILRSDPKSEREFRWLRWGLIPYWAKDRNIGNKLINARAETVTQKPSFRSAFRHCRCLIMASGFYEWQQEENRKQPFYIQKKDRLPFGFAGLYSTWQPQAGETISTCTIITTEANEIMEQIHKRMPVILETDDYDLWLDPTRQQPELLQSLLQPYNSDKLQVYPVSTLVNNPRNNTPECLKLIES
ncbi:MAG: SOS response-associated peptidase [Stanieria sp.]